MSIWFAINMLIVGLSLLGLAIASYFSLTFYHLIEDKAHLVPVEVCDMETGACRTVLEAPDAKVFGVPNSLLGILFYLGLLVTVILGSGYERFWLAATAAAWFTVLFGIYLIYALLVKIKIVCPLCFLSHGINVVLATALTVGYAA